MTDITQFMQWCHDGKEELIREHIKEVDLSEKSKWGETALYVAVCRNKIDIVRLLLDNGADLNQPAMCGSYPILYLAVTRLNFEMVKVLLDKKADVNAQDIYGKTALHVAAQHGMERITRLLLEYSADINILDNEHNSPLHEVVVAKDYLLVGDTDHGKTLQYLLIASQNYQIKNKKQQTFIDAAIEANRWQYFSKIYEETLAMKNLMAIYQKPITFKFNDEYKKSLNDVEMAHNTNTKSIPKRRNSTP